MNRWRERKAGGDARRRCTRSERSVEANHGLGSGRASAVQSGGRAPTPCAAVSTIAATYAANHGSLSSDGRGSAANCSAVATASKSWIAASAGPVDAERTAVCQRRRNCSPAGGRSRRSTHDERSSPAAAAAAFRRFFSSGVTRICSWAVRRIQERCARKLGVSIQCIADVGRRRETGVRGGAARRTRELNRPPPHVWVMGDDSRTSPASSG
jgi:hypothetical protein